MGHDGWGPDRVGSPPKPVTDQRIIAGIDKRQRQDDRAIRMDAAAMANLTPSRSFFAGFLTYDSGGTTWSSVSNATTSTNLIEPPTTGWYDCDVTWTIVGGTANAHIEVSAVGPGYTAGPGGRANVPTDGSGDGRVSAHWQGLLGSAGGLAVGGDEYFTAYVVGRLVHEL